MVSAASFWEIGIKISLGRLSLGQPFEDLIPRQMELNGFALLPLRLAHVARIITLPFHHRDPFDRLIVAQCIEEGFSVVSLDAVFDMYSIRRYW